VGNADAAKWVSGDTDGLNQDLLNRLAKIGEELGKEIDVKSGFRSREEQEVLYQKYLNGTGNLAAKPGTSNHESGNAADVNVDGTSLANVPGAKEIAAKHGIGFPVGGEPWHAEIV
jgi:LAS superfamily LD-carboxypeptidase LdcB